MLFEVFELKTQVRKYLSFFVTLYKKVKSTKVLNIEKYLKSIA